MGICLTTDVILCRDSHSQFYNNFECLKSGYNSKEIDDEISEKVFTDIFSDAIGISDHYSICYGIIVDPELLIITKDQKKRNIFAIMDFNEYKSKFLNSQSLMSGTFDLINLQRVIEIKKTKEGNIFGIGVINGLLEKIKIIGLCTFNLPQPNYSENFIYSGKPSNFSVSSLKASVYELKEDYRTFTNPLSDQSAYNRILNENYVVPQNPPPVTNQKSLCCTIL